MWEYQISKVWDQIAPSYDITFSGLIPQYMRMVSRETLLHYFKPGMHVLELGCGTGDEAIVLAKAGLKVKAIDISNKMIAIATQKAIYANVQDLVKFEVAPIEKIHSYLPQTFDGVFSSFGPLNCIMDLSSVGNVIAKILSPGGYFISTVMNRFALFEFAYYLLIGKPSTAVRRWKSMLRLNNVVLPTPVLSCRYYSPSQYFRLLNKHFKMVKVKGLCVVMPPPYLKRLFELCPLLLPLLSIMDKPVSALPLLRGLGDHFIMICVRRGE